MSICPCHEKVLYECHDSYLVLIFVTYSQLAGHWSCLLSVRARQALESSFFDSKTCPKMSFDFFILQFKYAHDTFAAQKNWSLYLGNGNNIHVKIKQTKWKFIERRNLNWIALKRCTIFTESMWQSKSWFFCLDIDNLLNRVYIMYRIKNICVRQTWPI